MVKIVYKLHSLSTKVAKIKLYFLTRIWLILLLTILSNELRELTKLAKFA